MTAPAEGDFPNKPEARSRPVRVSVAAAVCLLLLGGANVAAPTTATPAAAPLSASDEKPLPQIQVEAQRRSIEKRVRTFIAAITPREFANSLVRWHHGVCPVIVGPSEHQSDLILTRLSDISSAAGVPLATKPCNTNLYVILTPAPERLLQEWRKRDRLLFGGAASVTIDRFLNTPRAVRVWYNTRPGGKQDVELGVERFGGLMVPTDSGARAGASSTSASPSSAATVTAAAGAAMDAAENAARLEFNEVLYFTSVIVVVDAKRMEAVKLSQLADYVAMVGLAKINLDADVGGAPTILRTFAASVGNSEEPVPSAITVWDQDFLHGLYATRQSSRLQRSAIQDLMVHELVH